MTIIPVFGKVVDNGAVVLELSPVRKILVNFKMQGVSERGQGGE